MAQWIECWPANQSHGLDSQSGHMPGLQARSPVGGTQEATTHCCFSPSLSPSLPICLRNKINKILKRKRHRDENSQGSAPGSLSNGVFVRGKASEGNGGLILEDLEHCWKDLFGAGL